MPYSTLNKIDHRWFNNVLKSIECVIDKIFIQFLI